MSMATELPTRQLLRCFDSEPCTMVRATCSEYYSARKRRMQGNAHGAVRLREERLFDTFRHVCDVPGRAYLRALRNIANPIAAGHNTGIPVKGGHSRQCCQTQANCDSHNGVIFGVSCEMTISRFNWRTRVQAPRRSSRRLRSEARRYFCTDTTVSA